MSHYGDTKPPMRPRVEESARIAADLAAFLQRGGRIVKVPRGESGVNRKTGISESSEFAKQRGRALKKAREYHRRRALFE